MQSTSLRIDINPHRELKKLAASRGATVGDTVALAGLRLLRLPDHRRLLLGPNCCFAGNRVLPEIDPDLGPASNGFFG